MSVKGKINFLSIALLLSVALNVGLVAWIGGKQAGREFGGPRGPGMQSIAAALEGLPTDKRDAAEAIIKKYRGEMKQKYVVVREQRKLVRDMVNDPAVDPARLKEAFASMRQKIGAVHELNQQMLIELLPYVPPESRPLLFMRPKGKEGEAGRRWDDENRPDKPDREGRERRLPPSARE